MANWSRGYDVGGSVKARSAEWDEHWNALNYFPPADEPAWLGLLNDRPDLAFGQPHPTILGAYVDDFSPEPNAKGSGAYDVTVRYKREAEEGNRDLPPAQRPAVIDLSFESVEVPTFVFQNGDFILNTAGDLMGHTRTENHWIFGVQKNVEVIPAWTLNYADAVNNDAIEIKGLGVSPYYLLLKELRIPLNTTKEEVGGITYEFFPVSFSLVYNPRTWKTRILNRGLYEIDPTAGYRRIKDDEGKDVDEPQFLDADGKRLPTPTDPADIIYVEGWDHELLPFAALPLT